jgi:hypothetical protein
MTRIRFVLILSVLIAQPTLFAEDLEVHLNSVTVSESGAHLARGTFRLHRTNAFLKCLDQSTLGNTREPAPMYMLCSYLCHPTPILLAFPLEKTNRLTQRGRWDVRAVTTIDGPETLATPAGTFSAALKHTTVIAGAKTDSEAADAFVNGTRYLWLAKGIGIVRMRYEHVNGKVTEAVLLSYKVAGDSEDYLPLDIGNRWTYAWKNDYRQEAVIETCTIGARPQDPDVPARPGSGDEAFAIEAVDSDTVEFDLHTDRFRKIAPNPDKGFNFPYYLFVPRTVDTNGSARLLVEMNNTGTTSNNLAVHDRKARRLAEKSYANRIAQKLNVPLLVPVFPRPREQWQIYTHSLDEDTLLVESGPLKRIDLQLIQMIRDAQALLRRNGVPTRDKVFMHGYSASGTFTNRFPLLHPHVIRAVAAGGVNGIPTFPATHWHDTELPFPVGIADLKEIADIDFDEEAYKRVAQYIYMGYLDRNDTTLSRDTYCEEHAQLIRSLIGADMGQRWKVSQAIYRELGASAQCVTYNGTAHSIRDEMLDDVVAFFQANADGGFVEIEPHEYPFVEFQKIEVAHINGLYWAGDSRIPKFARDLFEGKGHFIITIAEWLDGQDHRQLSAFKEDAAFEFRLKASGHEDTHIAANTFQGTYSSGDDGFRGFVVRLPDNELSKLAPGVKYTIEPINQNDKYYWVPNESVALVRP